MFKVGLWYEFKRTNPHYVGQWTNGKIYKVIAMDANHDNVYPSFISDKGTAVKWVFSKDHPAIAAQYWALAKSKRTKNLPEWW